MQRENSVIPRNNIIYKSNISHQCHYNNSIRYGTGDVEYIYEREYKRKKPIEETHVKKEEN